MTIRFAKKAKKGYLRFDGRKIKAHRRHGRLIARVNFRGVRAASGAYATVKVHQKIHRRWRTSTRLYKIC